MFKKKLSPDYPHYPVMIKEIKNLCYKRKNYNFLDCTFGAGGYSKEFLKNENANVTAVDRDLNSEKFASELKKKYPKRFKFYNEKFSNLDVILENKKFDFIIFDLGISSLQLHSFDRGFSFKSNSKLDMGMGLNSIDASHVVNKFSPETLKIIFKILGEEKEASIIVKNIISERKKNQIFSGLQLSNIIQKSKKKKFGKKINPSTKTFQALRIFVNKEITELILGISNAAKLLKPRGKLVVVSFHSIEDKIVKFFFKNYSNNKSSMSRYIPIKQDEAKNTFFENYKNKIIRPSEKEIKQNYNSRSAKLRIAVRNNNSFFEPAELKRKFNKYLNIESYHV
tara:strand:- start:5047 stop:6063 length:1017 start_codon:yes stop_codon:yes gene_type:complete